MWRPEQLPSALLGAMRVLTDPVETGAVTVAIPQDVQAEAHDWPESLFAEAHLARRPPAARAVHHRPGRRGHPLGAAPADRRRRRRHLLRRHRRPRRVLRATGIPVGQSQAGKGSLLYDHPQCVGAIGSTGTTAANALAADADVVIGIGTRYSDFTTRQPHRVQQPATSGSSTSTSPSLDAVKQGGIGVVADAREAIDALGRSAERLPVDADYEAEYQRLDAEWDDTVTRVHADAPSDGLLNQNQVIGLVNTLTDPRDVVVCAAGSMPGDLHKLWRTRDRKGYHVEYGYSCMGYEVAGGIGVAMACPDRDVFVMVGDGSYLMMATELVTAVQEGVKVIVVLVQNHGFASIGALSEALGSQRFGTRYRYRVGRRASRRRQAARRPGRQRGQPRRRCHARPDRRRVRRRGQGAKASDHHVVIHVETDPLIFAPDSRVLVGRTGRRDVVPGVDPACPQDLRRLEVDPAAVSSTPATQEVIAP